MTECPSCGQKTHNPKFCSKTCAAKLNNRLFPKRKPGGRCSVCGRAIALRSKYCSAHKPNKPRDRSLPISALYQAAKHPMYRLARIRDDARQQYHAARPYRCIHCGYDKYIEVCHRRPLASFPEDTPLGEVNSLDNLVGLCPNCHWEFDHGLLQL
jgi:5-methylcytosine-specific restriction endonuclease McrA